MRFRLLSWIVSCSDVRCTSFQIVVSELNRRVEKIIIPLAYKIGGESADRAISNFETYMRMNFPIALISDSSNCPPTPFTAPPPQSDKEFRILKNDRQVVVSFFFSENCEDSLSSVFFNPHVFFFLLLRH